MVQAPIQTVEEIYRLIWSAVAKKQLIEATYPGRLWLFARIDLAGIEKEDFACCAISAPVKAGADCTRWARLPTGVGLGWVGETQQSQVSGRCLAHSAESFAALPPAWLKRISRRKIIPSAIHRKDIEGVARVGTGPGSSSVWQSNGDYAARGEPGDPRGRKSGAGPGATNPRWPARAEGEKRLRSATRNP